MNLKWEKIRFSTLSFIFILVYVNVFQMIFGPENTIVGVIFTIMMSASMARDLTATPLKHLLIQSVVLVWMAFAAFGVTAFPPLGSFFLNFATILVILYAFTYEYSNHVYFPYILSYLFLIFISPVQADQLPKRLLGMLFGAVSIILYQWFMGRKRVVETARDVLTEMLDDLSRYLSYRLHEREETPDLSDFRRKLCRLSQTVYERRKKVLCVSDASYSMIASGRGLEQLLILIHELPEPLSKQDIDLLHKVEKQLKRFRSFLQQDSAVPLSLEPYEFFQTDNEKRSRLFYKTLTYIQERLLHMTDPKSRVRYQKTALSFKVRLQAAMGFSPVRAIYSLRVALLLSGATVFVQFFNLTYGKWLLFTLASVSLPYADDVPLKMKKRIMATIVGGLISVIIYTLIPSATGRTAAMMLSGYVSFYFTDYAETFACSTIGALGGAVFMNAFGFSAVLNIFLIRFGYILAGAGCAYMINCLIFPYNRARATRQLWNKYKNVADLLTKICKKNPEDPQLYYNLVIQAHMLEEKLSQNASFEKWAEFPKLLSQYRDRVRKAHRISITE